MLPSRSGILAEAISKISTFPVLTVLEDTLFKQQQKYKIVSYLEPDLREIQKQPPEVFWKKRCS